MTADIEGPWPCATDDLMRDVRQAIEAMRLRLEDGQGTVSSAMCRLSLPMAEWLLERVDLAAKEIVHLSEQVDELADARERVAALIPTGRDTGTVEEDIERYVEHLRTVIDQQHNELVRRGDTIHDTWMVLGGREDTDEKLPDAVRVALNDLAKERDEMKRRHEDAVRRLESRVLAFEGEDPPGLVLAAPGPHGHDPTDCPTFYDVCNCTVGALESNIARAEQAEDNAKRWSKAAQTFSEELDSVRKERDQLLADLQIAATDFPVPIPEPGSDMARLLSANSLLKGRLRELEALLARIEWVDAWAEPVPACPCCRRTKTRGHTDGCQLAEVIRGVTR